MVLPFSELVWRLIGVCVFCAQLRLRTFYVERGKIVEHYNILEFDYSSADFKDMDKGDLILFANRKTDSLQDLFDTDPLLRKLNEEDQEDFLSFVSGLHTCAARERAEFSLAIHPIEKAASVVIVSKKLEMRRPLNSTFSASVDPCYFVYIEPIDENGLKLLFYFKYPLV